MYYQKISATTFNKLYDASKEWRNSFKNPQIITKWFKLHKVELGTEKTILDEDPYAPIKPGVYLIAEKEEYITAFLLKNLP